MHQLFQSSSPGAPAPAHRPLSALERSALRSLHFEHRPGNPVTRTSRIRGCHQDDDVLSRDFAWNPRIIHG